MEIKPHQHNIEHTGHRWQKDLGEFIAREKPLIVVETGVSEGVSTKFILEAMDKVQHGRLISIDPNPAYTTPHPRWALIQKTSHDSLVDIFCSTGPFDVFIHDSDHYVECTSYEYELAWHLVRPGGYIFSDDITWDSHFAWQNFYNRHGVEGKGMNYAGWIQKPMDSPCAKTRQEAEAAHLAAIQLSHEAARAHGYLPKYGLTQ